jgi:hypothetical protein
MAAAADTKSIEAEIAALPALGLEELRARWERLHGRPAPKFFRRKFLVRAVAYQMQVRACGGLSEATKRKLREIAAAAHNGTFDAAAVGPRIKPGTKLVRTWHGETHTVMALEHGFSWNGAHYSSLSAIAKAITGTAWNGWTFFGLKSGHPQDGRDVLGRFKQPAGPQGAPAWPRTRKALTAPIEPEPAHA